MIEAGTLEAFQLTPLLPAAAYAAICERDQQGSLIRSIASLAQNNFDFGRIVQTA